MIHSMPEIAVALDQARLDDADAAALTSVRVHQRLSLPSLCELVFTDPRGALAEAALRPGAAMRVAVATAEVPLFTGEVTAVELAHSASGGLEVRVRGYDVLHRLRKQQPARAHVQIGLADLARELTADLDVTVHGPAHSADAPRWPYVIQAGRSSLDVLADLARRSGVFFTLRGRELRFLTLRGDRGRALPARLGRELLSANIELNADPACRSVTAAGWDPVRAAGHRDSASRPRVGREVSAAAPPEQVGSDGVRRLVEVATPAAEHAASAAQAELDARVAREVVLRGCAQGDPRLRPGARVDVQGVARAVAGTYVITWVDHVIDRRRGFVSELSTAPPAGPTEARPGRGPSAPATLGEITAVDADTGRVRARLPGFHDVETDWMPVALQGAGKDKGLVVLPDTGDHVLVLLCGHPGDPGAPGRGVVIGGLYGDRAPPDADTGADSGAHSRPYTLRTPGGQVIELDDARHAVKIQDRSGSYVELAPDGVVLHAAADLTIEAPGKRIVLSSQAIDFRRR